VRLAVAGIVTGAAALVALLWRSRTRARRTALDDDLRLVGRRLADLRAQLTERPSPLRELLEALAAQADLLAEHLDRIAEEAFIATEPGDALRRLRAYDADLHGLAAEIRCLQAKA
jgi:hypothetical protein